MRTGLARHKDGTHPAASSAKAAPNTEPLTNFLSDAAIMQYRIAVRSTGKKTQAFPCSVPHLRSF